MTDATRRLYEYARDWKTSTPGADPDPVDHEQLLNFLLFDSSLRYADYIPYRDDGPLSVRLLQWLENVSDDNQRKILLELAAYTMFIDKRQLLSLYSTAYRDHLIPWLVSGSFNQADYLSNDYDAKLRDLMQSYRFFSITESFDSSGFLQVNNLSGLDRFEVLPKVDRQIEATIAALPRGLKGLVFFEDFVGTGKQSMDKLNTALGSADSRWRLIFIPLIAMNQGAINLGSWARGRGAAGPSLHVAPVLRIPMAYCLTDLPVTDEPTLFPKVRVIVASTARRVLSTLNKFDDPPRDPFGYKGAGGLVIPAHNAPNNTLPLIHHRAPDWVPLFRRLNKRRGT